MAKEMDFRGLKTYGTTKQILNGICWATYRRGNNPWTDNNNVIRAVAKYLWEHGADPDVYNVPRVKYVILLMVKYGYATVEPNGKRYVKFYINPDIDIRGYRPEFLNNHSDVQDKQVAPTFHETIKFDMEDNLPPIPVVRPPRYRFGDLNTALDKWADRDPETYAGWADKLIASVQTILDQ